MNPRHDTCTACGHQFTDHGWIERHTITGADADLHHLDTGDYHDDCCPLCSPNDATPR